MDISETVGIFIAEILGFEPEGICEELEESEVFWQEVADARRDSL